MNYKMKVTITKDGNEKTYDLDCVFFYEAEQYGNKHYLHIFGNEFYEKWLDIRYDTSFRRNEKAKYLEEWARSYWSGKNGAWSIKEIDIVPTEE